LANSLGESQEKNQDQHFAHESRETKDSHQLILNSLTPSRIGSVETQGILIVLDFPNLRFLLFYSECFSELSVPFRYCAGIGTFDLPTHVSFRFRIARSTASLLSDVAASTRNFDHLRTGLIGRT
jgi:hypothetical protein